MTWYGLSYIPFARYAAFNYLKLLEGLILAEISVILGRDTICKSLINQCNDEAEVVQ